MNPQLFQLTFLRVEYPIERVDYWLTRGGLDAFVFEFYFAPTEDPSRPLQLCCFVRNTDPGYFNPLNPDVLNPYPGEIVLLEGPVKLTGNLVTIDEMRKLVPDGSDDNFLLFTPMLDQHQQVMYIIQPFKRTPTGDVFDSGTTINSNPSPPATAMNPMVVTAKVAEGVQ